MKVIFSGLINDASNKIGDMVASHNRYGSFFRTWKSTPASGSAYWIAIRNQSESLSANWSLLTESERQAWNNASLNFRRSDSLGNPYRMSGMNLFCSVNMNRWLCGFGQLNLPPDPTFVPRMEDLSGSCSVSGSSFTISFSPAIPAGNSAKIWVTKPISAGINRAYAQFRMLSVVDSTFVSGDSIYTDYSTRFGAPAVAAKKIFLKTLLVDQATGLQGQPCFSNLIVQP